VVGFDCFTGLPEAWRPGFPAGWGKQDEQPVVPGARLVVGMFETTLSTLLQENPGRIVFVHLDADFYSSTSTVLRLLGDRLGPDMVWWSTSSSTIQDGISTSTGHGVCSSPSEVPGVTTSLIRLTTNR
jgi:hypothetical protein